MRYRSNLLCAVRYRWSGGERALELDPDDAGELQTSLTVKNRLIVSLKSESQPREFEYGNFFEDALQLQGRPGPDLLTKNVCDLSTVR